MNHEFSNRSLLIRKSNSGVVLDFNGEAEIDKISTDFISVFQSFKIFKNSFVKEQINQSLFSEYSAFAVTEKLAVLLNKALVI